MKNFTQHFPERESQVKASYFLSNDDFDKILLVKFSGIYPEGSAGNFEGEYMFAMLDLVENLYNSSGIIVDLSELIYVWGDMIDGIFPSDNEIKAIILGDKCCKAIESLVKMDWDGEEYLNQHFFDDFDSALNFIQQKIHEKNLKYSRKWRN